jgi:hypothetical protein
MARKIKCEKYTKHEFTCQIHSTRRSGTDFANMKNWNEKQAKESKEVTCKDCRFFDLSCSKYLGKYHRPCDRFDWW